MESQGKPIAVVVDLEQYEQLQRVKQNGFAALAAIATRNAGLSDDDVLADVTRDVEAIRQGQREQGH